MNSLPPATCPECDQNQEGDYPFTVKDITTAEDLTLSQIRLALRCESCGYAISFIAKHKERPQT